MLIRARELMIQAASDTVGEAERRMINEEVKGLRQEIDRIANSTTYNGIPLLNGEAPKSDLDFQVGIYNKEADRIIMNAGNYDVRADSLDVGDMSSLSIDSSRDSLELIDEALDKINEKRANLGALQNRLNVTTNSIEIAAQNHQYAKSRIMDADLAHETSKLVTANVLQSAGVAMLAQANQNPYLALKLL
jgi:flagellin